TSRWTGENAPTRFAYSRQPLSKGDRYVDMQWSVTGRTSSKVERIDWPVESAERNSGQVAYSSFGIDAARFFASATRQLFSPAMPTLVAMSSSNKWVVISKMGLLSGQRESERIAAVRRV